MDDVTLLDRFGPAPTALPDDALARARQRLEAATRDAAMIPARRPVRRRAALLAAAAALVAGVTIVSPLGSDDAIALVRVDPLAFPVTATYLPDGLPLERFTFNSEAQDAMYGEDASCDSQAEQCAPDRVTLSVRASMTYWDIPADATSVNVNGHAARGFWAPWNEHHPEYSIVWEQADGDVIGVAAEGRYANPSTVERIAESVTDEGQPVDLFLTVAPEGWPLYGYLSDQHVMYGEDGELAVTLLYRPEFDVGESGARDVRTVTVDGRPGELGRIVDNQSQSWVLQSTAPDGQPFNLTAPESLTEDQVVQIAAGVRHR